VWFHGDVAAGNLLIRDGRLAAVIDFGTSGVGDPACDLTIAWTLFTGANRDAFRDAFRDALPMDPGAWARGRGWTLWKALITVTGPDADPALAAAAGRVLEQTLR
jgi:aminoglycoside phosphotransferase (APT) family kinase protein